jgi:hypothetical protein
MGATTQWTIAQVEVPRRQPIVNRRAYEKLPFLLAAAR